jgi:N-acetylmuramoyl-L-alanine amidase
MDPISLFILKSVIVSGLLTGWYRIGLRNRRLHSYNRFFLLFTLYSSIQIPLLHFQWFSYAATPSALQSPATFFLQVVNDNTAGGKEVIQQTTKSSIDRYALTLLVAAMISITLLCIFLLRIARILRLSRKYAHTMVEGINLVTTDLPNAPFSFLNYLFWKRSISLETDNGKMIFRHEQAHILQKHTYDKLACQLLTCIFWMNPFYWFIQKELGMIHEFIADEQAVHDGDTAAFAAMLLGAHSYGQHFIPEHHFFSSPIKRRLIMLQTASKTSHSYARRIMALPLVASAIMLFSFCGPKAGNEPIVKAGKKIVLVVDPGHGGMDAGAQYGSLKEKDITLRIATRISELAAAYHIEVHLTRTGDDYPTLQQRLNVANALHADDFISIHVSDDPGKDNGVGSFGAYIYEKNPRADESRRLGQAIFMEISRQGGVQRRATIESKSIYVLRENNAPGLTLELGDIKNQRQMQELNDPAKVDALCNAMLKGVLESRR